MPAEHPAPAIDYRAMISRGGTFILDTPSTPSAIWGEGSEVLWAHGEALYICGPSGVGKTTLTGQLLRCRVGLDTHLLGLPVLPSTKKVLYLAMDRPRQIARSLARQFAEDERDVLNDRVEFWSGPPPYDMGKHPNVLLDLAAAAGADTVVIDSLKDAALKLSDDETGGSVNRAIQAAEAAGVEVIVLHHQKKAQNRVKPNTLDDVYGSTWLTAGAGSVILLWGSPGDAVIELSHLKQPAETVGPLTLEHHLDGTTTLRSAFDTLTFVQDCSQGVTAAEVARAKFGRAPSPAEAKGVLRILEGLASGGSLRREAGGRGGRGGSVPARFFADGRPGVGS